MLFVELALIRLTGENVLYLSFFANFILLGSFLGIGIGFVRAGRAGPIYRWTTTLLALLVGLTAAFPVKIDRTGDGLVCFGEFSKSGLPAWLVLPILFIAVAAVMAAIADGTARLFGQFEPLTACRLDILGAIGGTTAFALLAPRGSAHRMGGHRRRAHAHPDRRARSLCRRLDGGAACRAAGSQLLGQSLVSLLPDRDL